jgi:Ser/Thr protein kinase RdoA (MazF antagonist)
MTPISSLVPTHDVPYDGLSPDTVLDALAGVGLYGDGRLIQLNSYENRVYQVFLEDGRVVVTKFYRPGRWSDAQILEEHRFAAELVAAELPIAAAWPLAIDGKTRHAANVSIKGGSLAQLESPLGTYRFSVAQRLTGRAPELDDPATLEWVGRALGRIHAIGAAASFAYRPTLDITTFGTASRDWLLSQDLIPPDAANAWQQVTEAALHQVREAFAAVETPRTLRLHGDCHHGNILWAADGPHFVDLDDTMTGPAIQDLWMLLSGDRPSMTRQMAAVLEGYANFMDFDRRELRLIEPLRTLRMIHHSAWIARRWSDPAFPIAFPWFASPSYWAEQTIRLREQLAAMAEPPLRLPEY